ncbi:hypothetical protein K461DRAFT_290454 [Myriangium duriaei CBS 260.36]|uniref:Uncharacterized protein n=1 Tax=Myriangium duriaei CBS 260.36 TaxID=1168546 RepID=A0A9P4JDL4_9PEZI|nr:hypothetical protein K461DRAFT_290454 [Myriangium duriaei CBS 260.36]
MAFNQVMLFYCILFAWYVTKITLLLAAVGTLARGVAAKVPQIMRQSQELDQQAARTFYTTMSHVCLLILGMIFGSRIHRIAHKPLWKLSFINFIMVWLYFFSAAFVLSAAILLVGANLQYPPACSAAIYVCLVFYFLSKGLLQLFLVERAHTIRAHNKSRFHDPMWVVFIVVIALGFGTIMILAFIRPIAEVSRIDRICRISLPPYVAMPILVYDVALNLAVTAVFVHLLRTLTMTKARPRTIAPIIVHNSVSHVTQSSTPKDHEDNREVESRITNIIEGARVSGFDGEDAPRDVVISKRGKWTDGLIARSIVGAVLVLLPTIANMGILYHTRGREQGWICFSFCTIDVTWTVCVLHWLTLGAAEKEQVHAVPRTAVGAA